jgi:hypothetical protein
VNRDNAAVHTNTVEGFFSTFKRGMCGVYQFCGEKHLHATSGSSTSAMANRVANATNGLARADALLMGVVGRPLTYQRSHIGA